MRPKMLTLCGWGPYKREETVDFTAFEDKGIFLITGATGAGKTTIFDAISYALYGALSGEERDKEKGSVRSDFAEPSTPTYIELVMEHGGKIYRINRNPEYLRPKKRSAKGEAFTKEKERAVLYYPDGKVTEGVKEVNAALREILVLDYQQFKKISMIAQGEFAKLLVAPPKDKTKIFREIFDTGVYERFTQSLSVKARAAYSRVTEQKHKLEEDVRVLTEGLKKDGQIQETKDALLELTAGENWNYSAIYTCLKQLEKEAETNLQRQKEDYGRTEKQLEIRMTEFTKLQEENERILQFMKVCEEREKLEASAAEQAKMQERYARAVSASEVEKAEEQCKNLERQSAESRTELQNILSEREQLETEAKTLRGIVEKEEQIRSLLELRKTLEEDRKLYADLTKQSEGIRKKLSTKQKNYLEQDALCSQKQVDYEEAERKRRLNAIGMAAALLKEGEPCPVCGSIHHPNPAKAEDGILSEEALQELKRSAEEAKENLSKLHEEIVTLKTQSEVLENQTAQSKAKLQETENRIDDFKDEVFTEFLKLPLQEASYKLHEQCGRAGRIAGLIQEKDSAVKRLNEKEESLKRDMEVSQNAFAAALTQHGFNNKEDYAASIIPVKQREELRNDLESYRMKIAANKELYSHLEGTVSQKMPFDLTEQTEKLDNLKKERDNMLKEQKLWEQQLSDVKKTARLMSEKLSVIDRESQEYGYIKDLENMASGNNAKRLVFEQYVLAGYFEEILRAANLRFAKMSGGRYEMSRVEQVGDGRVKDNMEIQVLDYYTGKHRSVRTLSGGESFKASLALALGMSDVIQAMNGGIRVDTLFVDEGFGALDSESLDQACDTLMSLTEKRQLIGIISHVPELRERVGSQLIIEKTGSGSRIKYINN